MRRGIRGSATPELAGSPETRPAHEGGPPPRGPAPALSNARIAIVLVLASETMFFTGLIGAYIVLRGTVQPWPPPDQPRLPLGVTWANTAVLFLSVWTMHRCMAALERREPRRIKTALIETGLLGSAFLAIQGTEWTRLVFHGLTVSSSLYGATFYTLIGMHGLHVLGAVVWLMIEMFRFRPDRCSLQRTAGLELLAIYWYYVCALWAVLFPLVYLL